MIDGMIYSINNRLLGLNLSISWLHLMELICFVLAMQKKILWK